MNLKDRVRALYARRDELKNAVFMQDVADKRAAEEIAALLARGTGAAPTATPAASTPVMTSTASSGERCTRWPATAPRRGGSNRIASRLGCPPEMRR